MINFEEMLKEVYELQSKMQEDMTKFVTKGNKAAGTRARKTSLALERLYKRFRKASV